MSELKPPYDLPPFNTCTRAVFTLNEILTDCIHTRQSESWKSQTSTPAPIASLARRMSKSALPDAWDDDWEAAADVS